MSGGVLDRALLAIRDAGSLSPAELARRIGWEGGLAEQALRDLARGGYLEPVTAADGTACASGCGGCNALRLCRLPVWRLTEKARRRLSTPAGSPDT